ncbi:hypothetical protein [Paenibacillus sp. RC67]|uniref:hypothetical protein n=1 Tax=Paenibacillus sp. RC67 TaxID=3039392 RepID=UPI0024AE68E3|nr:hypothetical protein [Paenibacillus sp. RC67]
MGWSELQLNPNEYNETFKAIDEKLMILLNERKVLAKGKRFSPPREVMQEWANQYDLNIPQISWLLHSLNEGSRPALPSEPGELLNVLPIMKKSVVEGFQYSLTHSMQHQNGSIVFLEIQQIQNDESIGHVRPQLLLEVTGKEEYRVRRNGSHGGGGQSQVRFLVFPRLPDDIDKVHFTLIPYAIPMEEPPKEVVLTQEVVFD